MGAKPKPGPEPRKGHLFCSHCHEEKIIAYKIADPNTPLTSEQIADAVRVKNETHSYPEDIEFNFYPAISYKRGFTYCCTTCSQASANASLEKKKALAAQRAEELKNAPPTPVDVGTWDPPTDQGDVV